MSEPVAPEDIAVVERWQIVDVDLPGLKNNEQKCYCRVNL